MSSADMALTIIGAAGMASICFIVWVRRAK